MELITVVSPFVTPRSGRGQNKRTREVVDCEKDEKEWLREHVTMQTSIKNRKIKEDEARLNIEQNAVARQELLDARKLDREENDHRLHDRRSVIDGKWSKLDEQRMDLEATERRGMVEEKSEVLDILAALANRLN